MNQVEEFTLRVAGMNEVDAQGLAREVANQLTVHLPQLSNNMRIDEIKIQLSDGDMARPESLASHISGEIVRYINNAISQAE
jgi:hypothetical protein